jgi:hypothetical protein
LFTFIEGMLAMRASLSNSGRMTLQLASYGGSSSV